jgi:hypothetical protein
MTVFFAVLALIVVAALALAVELLRPEPVTEQGLADLNQALRTGRDHGLTLNSGPPTRKQLRRLRAEFAIAWAVCRLLGTIEQRANATPGLWRSWLRFHWLLAVVWMRTHLFGSSATTSHIHRLVAAFGDQRERAAALMQIDAPEPVSPHRIDA